MEFTEIQQNLKAIAATVTDGCRLRPRLLEVAPNHFVEACPICTA